MRGFISNRLSLVCVFLLRYGNFISGYRFSNMWGQKRGRGRGQGGYINAYANVPIRSTKCIWLNVDDEFVELLRV